MVSMLWIILEQLHQKKEQIFDTIAWTIHLRIGMDNSFSYAIWGVLKVATYLLFVVCVILQTGTGKISRIYIRHP